MASSHAATRSVIRAENCLTLGTAWLSLELRQFGLDGRPLALVVILPDVAPPVEVYGAFQAGW